MPVSKSQHFVLWGKKLTWWCCVPSLLSSFFTSQIIVSVCMQKAFPSLPLPAFPKSTWSKINRSSFPYTSSIIWKVLEAKLAPSAPAAEAAQSILMRTLVTPAQSDVSTGLPAHLALCKEDRCWQIMPQTSRNGNETVLLIMPQNGQTGWITAFPKATDDVQACKQLARYQGLTWSFKVWASFFGSPEERLAPQS